MRKIERAKVGAAQWIVASVALMLGCDSEQVAPAGSAAPTQRAADPAVNGAPACTDERPGCACEPGSLPVTCFADPKVSDHDTLTCGRGSMACRDGVWSACESLVEYMIRAPRVEEKSGPVGRVGQALIQQPTKCNTCNPACYYGLDRPTANDLDDVNAPQCEYDAELGGIAIQSLVDAEKRGDLDDPAVCGDGKVESIEECDDGDARAGDGCGADCRLEDGFHCATPGSDCTRTVCGDGRREGSEQCDDANLQIGDGCTPFCAREPNCANGVCEAVCGDGKVMPGEGCDDGNTRSGDGCSATCTLEAGFKCELTSGSPPAYMDLPIVYRDFRANNPKANPNEGHPDFQSWCCGSRTGMVETLWGANKKPVPVIKNDNSLSTKANFNQWYNDSSKSKTFADKLRVTRTNKGTYVFDSASFFPLTGRGFAAEGEPQPSGKNFHFTSEVRFWFQYEPGQKLTFRGDDDVWVFINGRLAVDLGGVHGALEGSVTLSDTTAQHFGLTQGGLYEAAVFQAERHTTQSNYRLELGGFFFGRTECASVCGDGIVTSDELCDDGANNTGLAGACAKDCKSRLPMYAKEAVYVREYDASSTCVGPERPRWGELRWQASAPGETSMRFELRVAPTKAELSRAMAVVIPVPKGTESGALKVAQALAAAKVQADDPNLRISAVLNASPNQTETPVLREFELQYHCEFAE